MHCRLSLLSDFILLMEDVELPLIVRKSRWPYFIWLILSLAVAGTGIFLIAERVPDWLLLTLLGVFCVVPLYFLGRLIDTRPELVISETGICDAHWNIKPIEWEDIDDAFVRGDSDVDYVCIVLRQPEEYRRKLGGIAKMIQFAAHETGFGDFTVKPVAMGLDARTVLQLTRQQIAKAKSTPRSARSSIKYNAG
jgi:hypothetical protein